jgi:uroporphyrinogen decarboxylase
MMNALTQASINYANMQLQTQIDAFQVFDSHAGLTSLNSYNELSGKWIAKIVEEIKGKAVSVVFANEMSGRLAEATKTNADFYSLDATRKLSEVRNQYNIGLQGNLPPEILSNSTAQQTALRTKEIIDDMKDFGFQFSHILYHCRDRGRLLYFFSIKKRPVSVCIETGLLFSS